MKLNYLTFMIRDLEQSISFYCQLAGLHVLRRFNPGRGEIAFLANAEGETMLELIQFDDTEKVMAKGLILSFSVCENLSQLRTLAIESGYNPSEIISGGPKPDYFTVPDPDGIIVEFCVHN